ncbi:MAG: AIR synthase-related protein, partial [Bacteroidales bacterium]|nr:AIR synthase-related protein [Bacteroidales bacterium]
MGSNGLTSARHDVFNSSLANKYPESYDNALPKEVVYCGGLDLTSATTVEGVTAGKMVLSPTRTYAPVIAEVLKHHRSKIDGLVHCSGGAQTKVLHFLNDGLKVVKDNLFPIPPLFEMIQQQSKTEWQEMYKVFNMGHRMEVYTDEKTAQDVIAISKSFNIDAQIIGRVEQNDKKQVLVKSPYGEFLYE